MSIVSENELANSLLARVEQTTFQHWQSTRSMESRIVWARGIAIDKGKVNRCSMGSGLHIGVVRELVEKYSKGLPANQDRKKLYTKIGFGKPPEWFVSQPSLVECTPL